MDFLNREAHRATDRFRSEPQDIDILRTLVLALPYGFSANISQLTEYGSDKPEVFKLVLKLIEAGIIDATSNNASVGEFLDDRQVRYQHVPDRYPFYFKKASVFDGLKLGTRNDFSMTADLESLLTNYNPGEFTFSLSRMHSGDQIHFEAGHKATVKKLWDRDDLAITKDLLETTRGGSELTPPQITATTRVISAMYMKNYATRRGLATCTGIPSFPYREVVSEFPIFDYKILRRSIIVLGGKDILENSPSEEIILGYPSEAHHSFAYALEAFLEAGSASIKKQSNQQDALGSMRVLFEQFFVKLEAEPKTRPSSLTDFHSQATSILLAVGHRIAESNTVFLEKWREYVPETKKGLVAITTATDAEDEALFKELKANGFTQIRTIRAGQHYLQEYSRTAGQCIAHLRTGAGSMGVLSAGSILPDALKELKPDHLISAGICFGLKPEKDGKPHQSLGDVLCATSIQDYETVRQGAKIKLRGDKLPVGPNLLQAMRIARQQIGQVDYQYFEGQILSGQKLVDDEEFVKNLRNTFSEAIGGEMEGNAVATASVFKPWQWILIKGICDWGMEKEDGWQQIAAERACKLAVATSIVLLTAEET